MLPGLHVAVFFFSALLTGRCMNIMFGLYQILTIFNEDIYFLMRIAFFYKSSLLIYTKIKLNTSHALLLSNTEWLTFI